MLIYKKDILLPKKNIDYSKWSVIACDQFTGNKDYWLKIKEYAGTPSTLDFIIPEAFISDTSEEECINNINSSADNSIYRTINDSFILVERQTPFHTKRLGLVCCIDLEDYDFSHGTKSLIRPSEDTLWERIVPRINVRENSRIEFPHIILLFDDRKQNILDNLYNKKDSFEKLYDFDLSGNGGHIKGYRVTDNLSKDFEKLISKDYLKETFNSDEELLFIVGDGNHSLATAKTCWEKLKKTLTKQEILNHPSRFCLVEICNLNDLGIEFYPIHRVVYNFTTDLIDGLKNLYHNNDKIPYDLYFNGKYDKYYLPPNTPCAIKLVQEYLDNYISNNPKSKIDYIHDRDNVISACNDNAIGIFLPTIDKKDIFEYVIKNGILPKKSFSIGKSVEKRYYLEGKYIK